jgi:cell wall-associated NlpC family hydrolase
VRRATGGALAAVAFCLASPLPATAATHATTTSTSGSAPASAPGSAPAKPHASSRPPLGARVLAEARRHRGAPYVYGAAGPNAFDCSGFVRYVYGRFGIVLPHSSYGMYSAVRHVSRGDAQPGDIIFLDGLGHVGIYAGGGLMWDAPRTGYSVVLRGIYGAYQVGRVRH